jgi:oxygen-independent coproporphyrinogen III oxidase
VRGKYTPMTDTPNSSELSSEDAALKLWLGKPAPRYTSYPTAPFFHAGVTGDDYARALGALDPAEPVSLYIHVPFCRALCLYCGCNTAVTKRPERVSTYLDAVRLEIARVAALAPPKLKVGAIHFGGGTPNILSNEDLYGLFRDLERTFDLSAVHDIAMELDPRTVKRDFVPALAACGFNRVSLGVQDFKQEVGEIVNRVQPLSMVEKLVAALRDNGVDRINFDVMYGLPKQTPESVGATAEAVAKLDPSRIALFSYAHVPSMKNYQKALEAHGLPDLPEKIAMEAAARSAFVASGLVEIGMDHFAKPDDSMAIAAAKGELHRNFQGYTEDPHPTLLAFGASAIGRTPVGYVQNAHDEREYEADIAAGRSPVRRGYLLTAEDNFRAELIERLMCDFAVDLGAVAARHGRAGETFERERALLEPFLDAGLVSLDGGRLAMTAQHKMAVRVVAHLFDLHAPTAATPSSRAA